MASVTYTAPSNLANISRLDTLSDGQAKTFGEIQAGGELTNMISLKIGIDSNAIDGTYDLYLVESQDGASWTDDIDPTNDTTDVLPKISDAQHIESSSTIYNASNRSSVEFNVPVAMLVHAEYIGFVLVNKSGFTVSGTTSGTKQPITVA